MSEDLHSIGERIRALRKSRDLSGRAFGDLFGVAQSHISQVERGQVRPAWELLFKLHREWRVSIDWLLSGSGPMSVGIAEEIAHPRAPPVEARPDSHYRDLVLKMKEMLLEGAQAEGRQPRDPREERAVAKLRAVYRADDEKKISTLESLLDLIAPDEAAAESSPADEAKTA